MKEIKANGYSVYFVKDISKSINDYLKIFKRIYSSYFILVDENTLKHCYPLIKIQKRILEDVRIIQIKSGEENKTIETCNYIWNKLTEFGADRNSLFINLGGGVITDMGGFAASTYKRGIDFVNIPTTLLAIVDASVGGKTGVNQMYLKNQIGIFANPESVFVYYDFIATTSFEQFKSGYAEIIKASLIYDKFFWNTFVTKKSKGKTEFALVEGIMKSIKIKNEIVKRDFKEAGLRKILNFGHTIGHALETYSHTNKKWKPLLHGEAVGIGMICESFISYKACGLKEKDMEIITKFLKPRYPAIPISELDIKKLILLMHHDKKNNKNKINFSLLSDIGKCEINQVISEKLIAESLLFYKNNKA